MDEEEEAREREVKVEYDGVDDHDDREEKESKEIGMRNRGRRERG